MYNKNWKFSVFLSTVVADESGLLLLLIRIVHHHFFGSKVARRVTQEWEKKFQRRVKYEDPARESIALTCLKGKVNWRINCRPPGAISPNFDNYSRPLSALIAFKPPLYGITYTEITSYEILWSGKPNIARTAFQCEYFELNFQIF